MPNFRYIFLTIAILFIAFSPAVFATAVTAVSPTAHRVDAPRNSDLIVDFDTAIDPQTINNNTVMIFGRWSGIMDGNFTFENNNQRVRFTPVKAFSAGEYVTITLAKDITDASGTPLTTGYTWSFWTKPSPGSMQLQEVDRIEVRRPGENHIQTYGAYAGDLNEDGYTDYSVPNEITNDVRVFLNDGSGGYDNFTVYAMPGASIPSTNEGADFNNDGHIDFVVGSNANSMMTVFMGDGTGGFSSITNYSTGGTGVRGITVIDADSDCDMDIVAVGYNSNNLNLLLNNGDGTFASPTPISGGGNGERAVMAADINNDGIGDLFVAAFTGKEMRILLGDGAGSFQLSDQITISGSPWMIAIGDVDKNGGIDVVTANSSDTTASVAFTDGQGNFIGVDHYFTGTRFPLAVDLGDLDGDGDLDMMVSNFGRFGSDDGRWRLWENDGTGNFVNPQDYDAAAAASCSIFHDRDNDGDLDVTCIDELDDLLFIFESVPTTIYDSIAPPNEFFLFENYPNPFNPETRIEYFVPLNSSVTLKVYDSSGQFIRTLVNGERVQGQSVATWDGTDFRGQAVASGVYVYRLESGGFSQSRKMILLR